MYEGVLSGVIPHQEEVQSVVQLQDRSVFLRRRDGGCRHHHEARREGLPAGRQRWRHRRPHQEDPFAGRQGGQRRAERRGRVGPGHRDRQGRRRRPGGLVVGLSPLGTLTLLVFAALIVEGMRRAIR